MQLPSVSILPLLALQVSCARLGFDDTSFPDIDASAAQDGAGDSSVRDGRQTVDGPATEALVLADQKVPGDGPGAGTGR